MFPARFINQIHKFDKDLEIYSDKSTIYYLTTKFWSDEVISNPKLFGDEAIIWSKTS